MGNKAPRLISSNLKRAKKVLFDVIELFESNDIQYHLEGGTLLGLVRDGRLLPWDYDVDISIPKHQTESFLKLKNQLVIKGYKISVRKSNKNFGPITKGEYSIFKVKPIIPYIVDIFYPKNKRNFIVLDVFVKVSDETDTYWQAKGRAMRVDNKYYKSFEEISALKRNFKVPNHYKDYLTEKYGDWSIPVKEWCCRDNEKTICGLME